jgi:hypothetical protein
MHRSLLPFILASLGSILFAWSINMPLFEWQVSQITTNPPHDIRFNPSPWIAKFGDSLMDSSVISYQFNGSYCGKSLNQEKLKSIVKRSWSEDILERITRKINANIIPWLWLLTFLSGFYIWWYTLYYKQPITGTLISTVIAMILFCILLDMSRPFYAYIAGSGCLEGIVTFNAHLAKIHYETLLALLVAIIAEAGAVRMMFRQIRKALDERKRDRLEENRLS